MYKIHSFNFRLITFAGNPNVSLFITGWILSWNVLECPGKGNRPGKVLEFWLMSWNVLEKAL